MVEFIKMAKRNLPYILLILVMGIVFYMGIQQANVNFYEFDP